MREEWLSLRLASIRYARSPRTIQRWAQAGLVRRRYTFNYEGQYWFPEYEDVSLRLGRNRVFLSKRSCPGPGRGHKKVCQAPN